MMFQLWFHAPGCSIITLPVAVSWGVGVPLHTNRLEWLGTTRRVRCFSVSLSQRGLSVPHRWEVTAPLHPTSPWDVMAECVAKLQCRRQ